MLAQPSLDHVIVCGKDLTSMRARLAAAGVPTVYGGRHSNRATEMALASFPDGTFLELLAIQPDADAEAVATYVWTRQLNEDAGPCAWSVNPRDINAEVQRLRAAGVPVGEPKHGMRNRTDGKRVEWEASQMGPEPEGTFFPYLQHDVTPRALRAFPQGKPTNPDFNGVTTVVIAVRNLDGAIGRFQQAYGIPAPSRQADPAFGAQLARLGNVPVILAEPLNRQSWLNGRLQQFGEGPCAYILSRKSGQHIAVSKTRWFGVDISWMDAATLGWHLGFE